MEIIMGLLLGILCMFVLLHSSVLLLAAAYFWKKQTPEENVQPQSAEEKSEEERRAELEMKMFNEGIANILSYDTRPRKEREE